jgi:hypothetical protein
LVPLADEPLLGCKSAIAKAAGTARTNAATVLIQRIEHP